MPLSSPPDPLLDDLNPEQRTAVLAPPSPLLILAGAGSGKTRVLTRRLGWLIRAGADPHRLLAITFTNKAAAEMAGRVQALLGTVARGMWVQTFHSACARILRREIGAFGYTPSFTILDGDDQRTAIREVLRELEYSEKMYAPAAVLGRISRAKNELRDPAAEAAAATDPWSQRVAVAYGRYQARLEQYNRLDFDDLLGLTVRLLETDPDGAGTRYRALFRHVLVDEYQDTNHAQYRMILALCREHRGLTAVGDEDQSIYRFRGADRGNLLRFEEDFPDATVVRLEQNYRSTQSILDAAGSVIGHNVRMYPKRLWTDRGAGEPLVLYHAADPADEAAFVAQQVRVLRPAAATWSDFAVLYRTHAQSRAVEEALLGSSIPYVIVGGLKFYERKEVKDTLAYLRLLPNPLDWPSFCRAVAVPRRGIGDRTLAALAAHLDATGEALPSALAHADEIDGVGRAAALLRGFGDLLDGLRAAAAGDPPPPVAEMIAGVLQASGLEAELRAEDSPESRTRLENLQELLAVAQQTAPQTGGGLEGLTAFLQQATLTAEADAVPTDGGPGAVVLLTLHAAKGLEFPVVFLLGLEDGIFPHARAITADSPDELEEERRLCYVGMTRAARRLFLTHAAERALYGGPPQRLPPSRFLAEVDRRLLRELGGQRGGSAAGTAAWTRRAPAATAAPPAGDPLQLRAGDRVVHPKWGEGTVQSCLGRGTDVEATIDFPDVGRRTVIVALARLRRA